MDWDEELKRQAAISALLAPPEDGQSPGDDQKVKDWGATVGAPEPVDQPETKSDWHKLADQIFETKTAQDQGAPDKKYDTQVAESVVPYGEREKPAAPKSEYTTLDTGKGAAPEDYPTIAQDQGGIEQAPDALTQVERGELWRLPWHPSKQQGTTGFAVADPDPDNPDYKTPLSPGDEKKFQSWVKANKVPFDDSPRSDYDMRGFWKAQQEGDPDVKTSVSKFDNRIHFVDKFKTPFHKTFSNESQYATADAPHWDQYDRLIDKNGNVVADESVPGNKPPPAPVSGAPSKYPAQIVTPDEAAGKTSVVNAPPVAATTTAPAPSSQPEVVQPQTTDDWGKLADSIFPSAKSAVAPSAPTSAGTLKAGEGNRVDPKALYSYLLGKFSDSGLVGYVPPDGERWGIKTGSAAEWAAFGLAVAKQESGFNARSWNPSDPGGSAGIFQFGQGQTQFTKGGNQFDPQESADAFVRSVEHYVNGGSVANMGATFGSIRRPNEAGQYVPWAQTVAGQVPVGEGAAKEGDWTKLADNWVKASPEEQAAGEKQNRDTLDNLNRSTKNPGDFWKKISQHIDGVPDDQRQQYADNWKREVVKNAQDFYGEKDPEKAFTRATSDPGFEAYVSNVGRGLAGAVGQADIGIGLMGKNIDNNRVDGFAKLVHPESTGEGRAGFIKTLTDIQDIHHRHDVFNEIYGNLDQNTKDAIGDPASILDSIDHLADPKYQADLNKAISLKKAWVDQQLAGDPSLRGTDAAWWTTGTGENIFNTVAAIVPGGIGAVVRTSTLGSQIYSANMDRIAQEHPSWSQSQVSDEASKSAFLQLAPQEAVMALSHGITAPLLKWVGAAAEKPLVRFGIGGGVQVGAAAVGGAAGQVGENIAENKDPLTNVPQAAGAAVVQSLPFAVHGGLHGVAEGAPVKPEAPREPIPDITLTENTKLLRNVVGGGAETAVPTEPTPILTPNRAVRTSDVLGPEPGPRAVSTSDVLGPQEGYTPEEPLPWFKQGVAPADRQDPLVIRGQERSSFTPEELNRVAKMIGLEPDYGFGPTQEQELRDAAVSPQQLAKIQRIVSPTGWHLGTEETGNALATPPGTQFWKSDRQRIQAEQAWIKSRGGESIAEQIAREKAATKLGGTPRLAQEPATAPGPPPPVHGNINGEDPYVVRESRKTMVDGVANIYQKERTAAGELPKIDPNEGFTTEELLARAVKMSPDEINQHVADIMQNKITTTPKNTAAAVRAKEMELTQRSRQLGLLSEENPGNAQMKQEADAALKKLGDFHSAGGPIAKMKEIFNHLGVGLQGGDLQHDLSTENGLKEKFYKEKGKAPPPQADPLIKDTATRVRKTHSNEYQAKKKLSKAVDDWTRGKMTDEKIEEIRQMGLKKMGVAC